eukprot:9498493-Pyramimonas_sp.AAC.1
MGLQPLERPVTQQNGPSGRDSKAHPATSEGTSLQLENRRRHQGLPRVPTGTWPRAATGGASRPPPLLDWTGPNAQKTGLQPKELPASQQH